MRFKWDNHKEDGIVKVLSPNTTSLLDGTQFLQKHNANLGDSCPRIFGTDISNCQSGASQMVDNNGATLSHNKNFDRMRFKQENSEMSNMEQLANKDRETGNESRGPLMEGKTQSTDDIHIDGLVQLENRTCRPLKKSRQCSITVEEDDEQVEDRCSDQNVVGGEDDVVGSTTQPNIWESQSRSPCAKAH